MYLGKKCKTSHRSQQDLLAVPLHLRQLRLRRLRRPPGPRDGLPAQKPGRLFEGVEDDVPRAPKEVAQPVHHLQNALQGAFTNNTKNEANNMQQRVRTGWVQSITYDSKPPRSLQGEVPLPPDKQTSEQTNEQAVSSEKRVLRICTTRSPHSLQGAFPPPTHETHEHQTATRRRGVRVVIATVRLL